MIYNDALMIIDRNYKCHENSLVFDLHEKSIFSVRHFWDCYDSMIALAKDALVHGADIKTAMKLTFIYQHILKEIIYHFDQNDLSHIEGLPQNYTEYLERLDDALNAYFCGTFVDESIYSLQR